MRAVPSQPLPTDNTPPEILARWSDGTVGEALRWYADEVLSPVDGVGRHWSGLNAGNSAS